MANVENPYETNLSNNLVVTSYVDEQQVQSMCDIQLINGNGYITGTYPTRKMNFYNVDPNEQTIAFSDNSLLVGMNEINLNMENPFSQYGHIKIIKDGAEITNYEGFSISYLGDFAPDQNNLSLEQSQSAFVEIYDKLMYGFTSGAMDYGSAVCLLAIFLMFTNYCVYMKFTNDPDSIIENENTSINRNKTVITLLGEEQTYKYLVICPKNTKTLAFSTQNTTDFNVWTTQYFNLVTQYKHGEFPYEAIEEGMELVNTIADFVQEFSDISYFIPVRLNVTDPNTDFNREIIKYPTGADGSGAMVSFITTGSYLHLSFDAIGGSVYQLKHSELEYPVNFIFECNTLYCFADNSVVETSKGQILMKDLTMDDEVKCWDFDNGCVAYAKPLFISVKPEVGLSYEAVFDDGTVCRYSAPHRCYCSVGLFVSLSNKYAIGCKFYFQDGTYKKLVEWRRVNKPSKRYTMLTDYHMNSFVDGILAGSNYCNLYHINKDMKYDKVDRPVRKNEFGVSDRLYKGLRLSEQFAPKKYITRWFDREGISKNL